MNRPLTAAAIAAARFTVLAGLSIGFLAAAEPTPSTTAKKAEETKTLEKFEVTGSRIKRLDYETPAPVETFTIADIEAKGYVNIGDFLQSLPFNSGTANSIYQTASFQRGAATTNIRGLGAQRSLTLINGRRAVPYALQSPNSGTRSVFDFNSLPSAAIESIGVPESAAASRIASELGVVDDPTMTSTLSSLISLRALVTALVVSDASSRTIQLIFSPAIVFGTNSIVFFCGMPSEAAGPVAERVTPMLKSAAAGPARTNASAVPSMGRNEMRFMDFLR